MSAWGQKATSPALLAASGLPPKAGHPTNEWACRLSAQADITTSPNDDLATAADLA